MIGTTNAGPLAWVDQRGRVRAVDGSWSLDWWVGADDRWHLPGEETAVRQRLVESTPVVETSMRVPGGDAVARVFGTRVPGVDADLIAIDVANETSIPFALAVVITGRRQVRIAGAKVVVDDHAVVEFGREPSRHAAGEGVEQVRDVVLGGEAGDTTAPAPGRVAALLFPLAHTARLRCTVAPGVGADPSGPTLSAAPEAEQVARGWRAQLDRGLGVRLPDENLAAAIDTARATLLLAAAGPVDGASIDDLATLAGALVRQGFAAEALGLVVLLAERQRLNGRFGRGDATRVATALRTLGDHWRFTHDVSFAEALAGPVAKAAHRIHRKGIADPAAQGEALVAAADLLEGGGQPEAAHRVRALVGFDGVVASRTPPPLDSAVDQAGTDRDAPGATGDDRYAAGPARFLDRVRTGLLDDDSGPRGAALVLLGGLPASWRGQPIEVHDAVTRFGRLSCALRWHGERPALLWDLEPWPDAEGVPVRLTAPVLDPGWSSTEPKGEALLVAAVPPAPPDLEGSFS